jgi:alpha-ketoglutarate-dependent taurine dioxygenase
MDLSKAQSNEELDGSLSSAIARDGFVFLKRWHACVRAEEIVSRTGRALTFGKGSAVHRVVPKQDAAPNTYSGMYGLNEFPFHNDMAHWRDPPRYLMLRCLKGHDSVATVVVDSHDVLENVGEQTLIRALVKPRRPINGTVPLLSLYRPQRGERPSLLRWDEKFIVAASPVGGEGMTLVRKALNVVSRTSISLCEPGDTLVIDNWRMLHGRSAVAADQTDRIIERAYLGELY